jgi:hypothetical protein
MANQCRYLGITPLDNSDCNKCSLFMNTCSPIGGPDGYAMGSECDCYLCYGCSFTNCILSN